jgi:hypothetical protein
VPCKAGRSFAWGQPEPNLRPDRSPHRRRVRPTSDGSGTQGHSVYSLV